MHDILPSFCFSLSATGKCSASMHGECHNTSFPNMCPIYLFMSGYGLSYVAESKKLTFSNFLLRIKKLYISYWWIVIPFIITGFLIHYYSFDWKTFTLTLAGMDNGEWWFYSLYVELLVLFYLLLGNVQLNIRQYVIFMVVLLVVSRTLTNIINFDEHIIWQRHLKMILIDVNIFVLGIFFARFKIFTLLYKLYPKLLYSFYATFFSLDTPILVRAYFPMIGITELILVSLFVIGLLLKRTV